MDFINFKCSNGYSEPCWSTHLPFPISSLSSPTPANSNMMETQNVMQIMSVGWGNNIVFRYSTVSRLGFFFFLEGEWRDREEESRIFSNTQCI